MRLFQDRLVSGGPFFVAALRERRYDMTTDARRSAELGDDAANAF
jgi:hypothetical protein